MATNYLIPPVAPNLPLSPELWDRQFQDQFANVLRLYFNQLNNFGSNLLGPVGGRFTAFPYAAIQRTTDLTFTANTPTEVTFDQNDFLNACTNDGTNGITVLYPGLYNYQFSVQWKNTDSQAHDAWIWLRINDADVPGTASQFTVPSKHGSEDGHLIAAANFYVRLNSRDSVKFYVAVSNTQVSIEAYPAQTTPFVMPSVPSVVATLSFVSAVST